MNSLHEIISLKGIAEDNFNFKNEMIEIFKGEPLERPFFILIKKTILGKKTWITQMMSEDDYCPECSRNGKIVTHKRNNDFNAFRVHNKKWLKQLDIIHQLIY